MTSTRPNGLITPAQPLTVADPYSQTAQQADEAQRAARAAMVRADGIDYVPVLSEREVADLRLKLELQREAKNRGVTLRGLATLWTLGMRR